MSKFAEAAIAFDRSPKSVDVTMFLAGKLQDVKSISAIEVLARHGVRLKLAKCLIEELVEGSVRAAPTPYPVNVLVPTVEDQAEFADALSAAGVRAIFLTDRLWYTVE